MCRRRRRPTPGGRDGPDAESVPCRVAVGVAACENRGVAKADLNTLLALQL